MLTAADEHLQLATSALFQAPPQGQMVQPAIMAAEMYLKAFLCIKNSLTEDQLRNNYKHNLKKLVDDCLEITPSSRLQSAKQTMRRFLPSVNDRYTPSNYTLAELWKIYKLTLFAAAEILRLLSGRNLRKNFEQQFPIYAANEFK